MKIIVYAKPMAHEEAIEKIAENSYKISVKEPPFKGRANEAITKVLAKEYNVAPSDLRLITGYSSKVKTFEILNG